MSLVTIRGRLLRWGNSYGLRIARQDVDRLRLRPGSEVEIKVNVGPEGTMRPMEAPSFDLGGRAADEHDRLFAEGTMSDLRRDD